MIPAIFAAISGAVSLFETGKQVYETVTGKPSQATTAEQLQDEVGSLPADQRATWVERMDAETRRYQAETDRQRNDQGDLTPEMMQAIGPDAARKVALARMTFRPWAGRMSMHVMLTPMYVMWVDTSLILLRNLVSAFGGAWEPKLVMSEVFKEGSVYLGVYEAAVPWATSIVLTLITLRHVQKSQGGASPLDQVSNMVSGIAGFFGRKASK